jgi:lipoyl synthase
LGQYLQPTPRHLPVIEFVPPSQFDEYAAAAREWALSMWRAVRKVRSSYHADDFQKPE